jgi:polyketide biosynthesis acyl carrier protein
MNRETVLEIIKKIIVQVVPAMKGIGIEAGDTFRSYNINSIERMEVNMLLLEEVELDIPRVELLKANTFGELADIICKN